MFWKRRPGRGRLAVLALLAAASGVAAVELPAMQQRSYDKALEASPPAARSIYRRAQLDPTVPVSGNPAGDLTVVEYFDYQCGYCRAVHADIRALLAEDGDLRLVHKDWPIFGEASEYAARAALAAKWQGRYAQAQHALMTLPGRLDRERVRAALAAAGIDLQRLDRDLEANAREIGRLLRHADDEATAIGLDGTPGFLIGGAVFVGAMDLATLRRLVAEARRHAAVPVAAGR